MTPDQIAQSIVDSWWMGSKAQLRERITAAISAEREQAREWAQEAHIDVASWGAYASEYFQEKWKLADDLKKWEARAKEGKA